MAHDLCAARMPPPSVARLLASFDRRRMSTARRRPGLPRRRRASSRTRRLMTPRRRAVAASVPRIPEGLRAWRSPARGAVLCPGDRRPPPPWRVVEAAWPTGRGRESLHRLNAVMICGECLLISTRAAPTYEVARRLRARARAARDYVVALPAQMPPSALFLMGQRNAPQRASHQVALVVGDLHAAACSAASSTLAIRRLRRRRVSCWRTGVVAAQFVGCGVPNRASFTAWSPAARRRVPPRRREGRG